MKAKELAKILMENPEAEVVHYQYNGGCTPLMELNDYYIQKKDEDTESPNDGGDFLTEDGKCECDMIILTTNCSKSYKLVNEKKLITYQGYDYLVKKINIDVDTFDYYGQNEKYNASYVVDDGDEIRVRFFEGIYDENNNREAFDPTSHSNDIYCWLKEGDETHVDCLYEIIETTNKTGEINYDYIDEIHIHEDLKSKYKENIKIM
jgi:hypothetical protein